MKTDTSWMLAFIEDLRDVAQDRGLADLATDLDRVIDRHGASLSGRSEPVRAASSRTASNIVDFTARRA